MLAVILLAGSAFAALSAAAKNRYWAQTYLQDAVFALDRYEQTVAETDAALQETESIVHTCNENALPVREDLCEFFAACDQAIVACFQDVYGVDVAPKLNALRVMESTYPETVSQTVGGSYSDIFPDRLFLNAALLDDLSIGSAVPDIAGTDFSVKMLRTVYIHEAIHYLGFHSDSIFEHFTEAVCEYLNQKVTQYSGIQYESITGYAPIQGFAAQAIECDPQFVTNVLRGGRTDMGAYFNEKLGGGENYAAYYDRLIGLIQSGGTDDLDEIVYYAQYLTYEYCKAVNPDARAVIEVLEDRPARWFELKWLLHRY